MKDSGFSSKKIRCEGYKFTYTGKGEYVGSAYLYIIRNDRHKEPYGLLENLFIDETFQGKGYGKKLVKHIIKEASKLGCYKILATSRTQREGVHKFYKTLGFTKHGLEFRLNIKDAKYLIH